MREVICYNETQKLEFAYVMFQSLANECYRLQTKSQRFNRLKTVKAKYFTGLKNRAEKRKAQKLVDIEMRNFDNEVMKYIKNTNFMCDSFTEQIPDLADDLIDIGTDFLDKYFIVKEENTVK